MVWRSLHHKEILLSEPGRNRREFILTRNSPLVWKLETKTQTYSVVIRYSIFAEYTSTLISNLKYIITSSGWSFNNPTNISIHFSCWNRSTFSGLMAHFQMAPVAAANNSLLSVFCRSDTIGSSPPYCRTKSRVSFSSAHYGKVEDKDIGINSYILFCIRSMFQISYSF